MNRDIIKPFLHQGAVSSSEKYADLHLHTTASDGTLTPRQMVQAAKEVGLSVIAITDHDTVSGLAEALEAGQELDIEVIPGIELSTIDSKQEVHILGYYIDTSCQNLLDVLSQMIHARDTRAVRMIEKLNELGVSITLDRVREISGNEFMGRPHIARAMIEAGYIKEHAEAFTTEYIGSGGRAYVERYKITPEQAISLIHEAGGVAVLAHPGCLGDGGVLGEEDIVRYVGFGLDGVEVYYAKHSPEQVEYYKRLALTYGLMMTGGSDFHGGEGESLGVMLKHECVE